MLIEANGTIQIGSPRVGKTAISEEIAQMIINGKFKTVISCQRARAHGPCRALSRITEGSFVVGRRLC